MNMQLISICVVCSCLMLMCEVTPRGTRIDRVWALDDGEKIKQDDLMNPLATGKDNSVWDGERIRLFGARNEIVAFQIMIQSGDAGASSVSVSLDSLVSTSHVIKNIGGIGDPLDYVGKRIELFAETYINVTRRTKAFCTWQPGARPSDYYLGLIPDGLVPFQVGGRRGGAPFDILPNKNQGVWVDIYIPKDALPETYDGIVHISERDTVRFSLPVSLQVFEFTLPDSTHLHSVFHADEHGISHRHGVARYSAEYFAIEREYFKMAHRHRMDLCFNQTVEMLDEHAKGYFTGEYYSPAFKYDGPGTLVGNTSYAIGQADQPDRGEISGFTPATEEGWRSAADAWVSWFDTNAPHVEYFKYMADEPDSTMYATIKERADWIHNNPGPGSRLKVYCTVRIDPRLFGYVDYWAVTGPCGINLGDNVLTGYVRAAANERRGAGEQIAFYNGARPAYGTVRTIDADAIDARVNPWIAWKYDIDQYFLWHVNWYYQDSRTMNPWVDNYVVIDGDYLWGEGTFFYPGEDKVFPGFDRGIAGPIASIRMKNWRRGQQDYEYLWLARKQGLEEQASQIVHSLVPFALDECPEGQDSPAPWAVRSYQYELARRKLARLLEETQRFVFESVQHNAVDEAQ